MALTDFSLLIDSEHHYALSQPEWLWLIPIYFFIRLIIYSIKNNHLDKSTPTSLAESSTKKILFHPLIDLVTNNKVEIKKTFKPVYFIIFILITLSLTQPVKIGKKLPDPPQARDIIFIVDTSVSMILRDYILNGKRIDRMSLLKGMLDKFIQELNGERMSIIVFGDQAFTLVPLTSDQALLRRMLSRVQATMAGRFNAMGEGIALAVKQASQSKHLNKNRKKILVLLTDADQPTGKIDPAVAANLAKKAQLPLYSIAIGASSLAAEEKRLGGLLYSPVDLKLIEQLSSITGSSSYQAGNPKALEKAVQAIKLHATNKQKVKPEYFRTPLYHWILILAFLIFSLQQLFGLFYNNLETAK